MDVAYEERGEERVVRYHHDGRTVELATPRRGYGMVVVRNSERGELERYYGLDMAVDHAAEVLRVGPDAVPVPSEAADMGI